MALLGHSSTQWTVQTTKKRKSSGRATKRRSAGKYTTKRRKSSGRSIKRKSSGRTIKRKSRGRVTKRKSAGKSCLTQRRSYNALPSEYTRYERDTSY